MRVVLLSLLVVSACKSGPSSKPSSPLESSSPPASCDDRAGERQRWFTASRDEYDGRKPSDGFRVLGSCSDKLVDRQLSCEGTELRRRLGDSPLLRDALELGFKTYVCETANSHAEIVSIEYPLANVLTKRADFVQKAMAKMEGFKNAMCRCKAGDRACAEKVDQAMKDYADSMRGKERDVKVSDEDQKKMLAMMGEMAQCQMAAMGGGNTP